MPCYEKGGRGRGWMEEIKEVVKSCTLYNGIWSTPLEGPSMLSAVHAYWKLHAFNIGWYVYYVDSKYMEQKENFWMHYPFYT